MKTVTRQEVEKVVLDALEVFKGARLVEGEEPEPTFEIRFSKALYNTAADMEEEGFSVEARILRDLANAKGEVKGNLKSNLKECGHGPEYICVKCLWGGISAESEESAKPEPYPTKTDPDPDPTKIIDRLALKLATVTALLSSKFLVDDDGDAVFGVDRDLYPKGVRSVWIDEDPDEGDY